MRIDSDSSFTLSLRYTKPSTHSRVLNIKYLAFGAVAVTIIVVLWVVFIPKDAHQTGQRATCKLIGSVKGTLVLEEVDGKLKIEGKLSNITLGKHAIHIHESGNNCLDAGPHYNPTNVDHGGPTDKVRHIGDFGNFDITSDPFLLSYEDPVAKLHGSWPVLDRGIVIHASEDDLGRGHNPASKKNGNAGARLACCPITAI
ncbi:superoxide dismutase [Cu-Zn]-like isoform X2 [Varroa destructor]|uniref:Superoxide dismutase [Cu-Zn] n=1 Tax=Varroa destructor TaxID=109461 RepID=A0A7M7KS05_VARDE|nr:superoxide dismutase [Cu-Zn]-like isoform X2 [Varroa destructor]